MEEVEDWRMLLGLRQLMIGSSLRNDDNCHIDEVGCWNWWYCDCVGFDCLGVGSVVFVLDC